MMITTTFPPPLFSQRWISHRCAFYLTILLTSFVATALIRDEANATLAVTSNITVSPLLDDKQIDSGVYLHDQQQRPHQTSQLGDKSGFLNLSALDPNKAEEQRTRKKRVIRKPKVPDADASQPQQPETPINKTNEGTSEKEALSNLTLESCMLSSTNKHESTQETALNDTKTVEDSAHYIVSSDDQEDGEEKYIAEEQEIKAIYDPWDESKAAAVLAESVAQKKRKRRKKQHAAEPPPVDTSASDHDETRIDVAEQDKGLLKDNARNITSPVPSLLSALVVDEREETQATQLVDVTEKFVASPSEKEKVPSEKEKVRQAVIMEEDETEVEGSDSTAGITAIMGNQKAETLTCEGDVDQETVAQPETNVSKVEETARVADKQEEDHGTIKISCVTWNLAEESPSEADLEFLRSLRDSDIVFLSGQECENIKPRRSEGRRSREWRRLCIHHLGRNFVPVALHSLGGIQLGLFVRRDTILADVEFVKLADVACGIGNTFHNKGAIGAFVVIRPRTSGEKGTKRRKAREGTKMLFVSAHLEAHVKNVEGRNDNFWRIVTEFESQAPPGFVLKHGRSKNQELSKSARHASPVLAPTSAIAGAREDHDSPLLHSTDHIFFCGDLNYRVELPREITEHFILQVEGSEGRHLKEAWLPLLRHDQLLASMASGQAFPGLAEGKITFPPTFKFDKGSLVYDSSSKQRVPAWTDRILFKPNGVKVLTYDSALMPSHSDHRPVYGTFAVRTRRLGKT